MELFDYIKFRWKELAVLALLGAIAILVVGHSYRGSGYEARADILLRPPADQVNTYASNPDRYTNTQMTLLRTREYLEAEIRGTDATVQELHNALSYEHDLGSETVTLIATTSSPNRSVELVNAAARGYLDYAERQNLGTVTQQSADLARQIKQTKQDLAASGAAVKRATQAYVAANPTVSVPPATSIAPEAAQRQAVAASRLTQLQQQQTQLDLTRASSASRSSLLRPATRAADPAAWSLLIYLAAFAGLALVLLVLAAVGLALTTRVLSQARWDDASSRGSLNQAVRLNRWTPAGRRRSARQVLTAVRTSSMDQSGVVAVFLPERSPSLLRKSTSLLEELVNSGVTVREAGAFPDFSTRVEPSSAERPAGNSPSVMPDRTPAKTSTAATAPASLEAKPFSGEAVVWTRDGAAAVASRVILLVDLTQARLDDVRILCDYPEWEQQRLVPVLI